MPGLLWVAVAAHAVLHLFYILTWHTSQHTQRVVLLSSEHAKRRRGGAYGAAELAWYFAGTSFDIATHAAVLWVVAGAPGRGA